MRATVHGRHAEDPRDGVARNHRTNGVRFARYSATRKRATCSSSNAKAMNAKAMNATHATGTYVAYTPAGRRPLLADNRREVDA